MTLKKKLGQYYTTNHEYILQGMLIPDDVINIIEPFTGKGDLISFIKKNKKEYNIECYDIDPKIKDTMKRDTLMFPPDYTDQYIITNPPYLARNKSSDKKIFDKYDVNDLFKCLIKELTTNLCIGGILIIPLNFWSSIRIADIELRKCFIEKYDIHRLNIFEENVFEDTSYTVCSVQFSLKKNITNRIDVYIYPSKKEMNIELMDENNYMIGGNIYKLKLKNEYTITRLTKNNKDKDHTNIIVKCIDDNESKKIGLSMVNDKDIYIDNTTNLSSRTYATLIIEPYITIDQQEKLVIKFNEYLNMNREKYNSLFLTNYRESKDIARKRISFDLVYSITEYILENFDIDVNLL